MGSVGSDPSGPRRTLNMDSESLNQWYYDNLYSHIAVWYMYGPILGKTN